MKKKIALLAIITAAICAVSGCGGKTGSSDAGSEKPDEAQSQQSASFTAADVANAVISEVPIQSGIENNDLFTTSFYGMDMDTVSEYSYWICPTGAYPDELAIIHFNSSDSAANALSVVQTRLSDRDDEFRDYKPAEAYKLDNAVVEQKGEWIYYLVTSDNDKAAEIAEGYIK